VKKVYLGTFGTYRTFSAVERLVDNTLSVWEYPPLPLLRFIRDLGPDGFAKMYSYSYHNLAQSKSNLLPVWHASHVPICSRRECVNPENDYGGNWRVVRASKALAEVDPAVDRRLVVNFHLPKERVYEDRDEEAHMLAKVIRTMINYGRGFFFTYEPQYTPHADDLDTAYMALSLVASSMTAIESGAPMPYLAVQLENEFIRDNWMLFEEYNSGAEVEKAINVNQYWYKKLTKLYEYSRKLLEEAGVTPKTVPLFLRYAKVEAYQTPTGGITWKKRVPLEDNCRWCVPHLTPIVRALARVVEEHPDAVPIFIYTGIHYSYRVPEEELVVNRAREIKKIEGLFKKYGFRIP